ncbi:uncharacterized protein LOC113360431 [Papaver somniferum]|uniref:uncharacterized protein LOC113360431 n=1 Tax=Papaver somniferum TaxID=3469 RepID=UPI000E701CDC|nr:uncharacterized protein LOC113360431 [Papaver somniferum]
MVMYHMCESVRETTEHLLMECPYARAVWFGLSRAYRISNDQSLLDLIKTWFTNPTDWEEDMIDWVAVDSINQPTKSTEREVRRKEKQPWTPPPEGTTKINYDASFKEGETTTGPDFVDRDHRGALGTTTTISTVAASALMAESLAAKEAVQWALRNGVERIILEGDNQEIRDNVEGTNLKIDWKCKNILEEIKELAKDFSNFKISLTKRTGNEVADALAKEGRT